MPRLQKIMIANALLVILAAMLAGFMLGFSLTGGLEVFPGVLLEVPAYGSADGWARAHTGGVLNGLLLIAIALCLPLLALQERHQKITAYGLVAVAWANTVFYWLGNAAGSRALSFADNTLGGTNVFGMIGYGAALIAALFIIWLLAFLAHTLLKDS